MESMKAITGVFLVMILPFTTGCMQSGSSDDEKPATTVTSVSPLDSIVQANLPATGTLAAQLFMDSGTTPVAEKTIDDLTSTSVSLTAAVSPGDHTFIISIIFTDPVYNGPWQVAQATKSVNVVKESNNIFQVDLADYVYQDYDQDGLTNLAELNQSMATDPGDARCIMNKSIIGSNTTAGCKTG